MLAVLGVDCLHHPHITPVSHRMLGQQHRPCDDLPGAAGGCATGEGLGPLDLQYSMTLEKCSGQFACRRRCL
jgi:hypothetical protein